MGLNSLFYRVHAARLCWLLLTRILSWIRYRRHHSGFRNPLLQHLLIGQAPRKTHLLGIQLHTLARLWDPQSLSKGSKERMSNSVTQQVHYMQGGKFDALTTTSDYKSLALCIFCKSFFKDWFYYSKLCPWAFTGLPELSWSSFPAAFVAPSRNRE